MRTHVPGFRQRDLDIAMEKRLHPWWYNTFDWDRETDINQVISQLINYNYGKYYKAK